MKGVFRAPTPPPTEAEILRRRARPATDVRQVLEEDFFPASRDDIIHGLLGYSIRTPALEVPGGDLARGLRERVYRSLDQLCREVEGT